MTDICPICHKRECICRDEKDGRSCQTCKHWGSPTMTEPLPGVFLDPYADCLASVVHAPHPPGCVLRVRRFAYEGSGCDCWEAR